MFLRRRQDLQFGVPEPSTGNTGKIVAAVGILGGLAAAIGLASMGASSGKKSQQAGRMAGAPLRRKRDCNCGR